MTSGDEFGRTCINKANVAISNFPTFFEILLSAPPTPQTQSYHKHCVDLLFEGWCGVTEWIAFLLQMIPQLSSHAANRLLNSCCDTIFTIVSHGKENAMAEELSCSPITCDMVYSFLQSMDISTTQYRILSPGGDTDACLIAKLYAHSFSSESGKRAMISSFRRRDRWGRRYIRPCRGGTYRVCGTGRQEPRRQHNRPGNHHRPLHPIPLCHRHIES
ncbi:hypothetical protein FA13DRAFT_636097 [Coprinellus micaceus]|uniref:Uncharacterized protein n=1 Tax=Coprinellus micaceus TaxID=71717 RepID=A0A4Y7S9X6_COPMI|nr:hypothetical protein FA13DRAFT_636097 [Coprinellus micaceus]